MKYRSIAFGLLAAAAAQADVQVNFVKPETFSDIKDNHGFRRDAVLQDIEAHLKQRAESHLPGREVRINVTDVNLAGEVEPLWRSMQWLRVMRSVTLPGIEMNYQVLQAGTVVQQGDVKLRDMNYQGGFNSYSSGDPLRYEKRMIDRWFMEEFSASIGAAH